MLYIKIALIAGLMLASPAVFTQVWLFVAPGLYAHEKKWAIPFVADVVVLLRRSARRSRTTSSFR